MRFRSDSHRRAVFASLGSYFSKKPIEFVMPDNLENPECYVPIEVSVKKFDRAWKNNADNYFEKAEVGGFQDRYKGIAEEIESGKKIPMPEAYAKKPIDGVDIADGRHRAANIRDLGYKKMKIAVPEFQREWFEEKMGA